MKLLLVIAACAAAAFAAEVAGPVSGYIVEEGTVRPILGVPGAARVGDPVFSNALAISGVAGTALTCTDGVVLVVELQSGKSNRIEAIDACPTQAIFSPSGTAAALVFASRLVILRGASIVGEVESAACSPSDDGELLLCPTGSQVRIMDRTGALRSTHEGRIGAFLPASHDVVIATASEIVLLRDGAGPEALAAFEGATSVAAMAGTRTVVAARADQVLAVATNTRAATALQAPAAVLALYPVRAADAVHMSTGGSGPLWLLIADSGGTRLMFVPREEASNE